MPLHGWWPIYVNLVGHVSVIPVDNKPILVYVMAWNCHPIFFTRFASLGHNADGAYWQSLIAALVHCQIDCPAYSRQNICTHICMCTLMGPLATNCKESELKYTFCHAGKLISNCRQPILPIFLSLDVLIIVEHRKNMFIFTRWPHMHPIVSIDYITKSVHPFVYPSGPKTLLIIPDQGEEFKWRILSQIGWLQFVIDKALFVEFFLLSEYYTL